MSKLRTKLKTLGEVCIKSFEIIHSVPSSNIWGIFRQHVSGGCVLYVEWRRAVGRKPEKNT
jgi:hypothetical protein